MTNQCCVLPCLGPTGRTQCWSRGRRLLGRPAWSAGWQQPLGTSVWGSTTMSTPTSRSTLAATPQTTGASWCSKRVRVVKHSYHIDFTSQYDKACLGISSTWLTQWDIFIIVAYLKVLGTLFKFTVGLRRVQFYRRSLISTKLDLSTVILTDTEILVWKVKVAKLAIVEWLLTTQSRHDLVGRTVSQFSFTVISSWFSDLCRDGSDQFYQLITLGWFTRSSLIYFWFCDSGPFPVIIPLRLQPCF